MILYFTNRMLSVLGFASTGTHSKFRIVDDTKIEDAESGISSFEFEVVFDDSNRLELEQMIQVGNCVLRSETDGVESYSIDASHDFFTITETEVNVQNRTIYAYAEDAGLDLINDLAPATSYSAAVEITQYITDFASNSGFKLRTNELEGETRQLSWDSESTVLERLQSIAESFDCDISFSFEIRGLSVVAKYIDITESAGTKTDIILYMDRDIENITVKKSIDNLATALHPIGNDGLTLSGYSYDNDDFYTNGEYLFSRTAFENWQRYSWDSGSSGDVYASFSCDAKTQLALCEQAIVELTKRREPEVNYEVEIRKLSASVKIRDRISIVDDKGELYLSAKVLQLETSASNKTKKAVLGDYLIQSSGISNKVQELSNRFAELSIERYTWVAYADDAAGSGISLDSEGKAYLGIAYGKTVEAVDISDPSVFKWMKVQGETGGKGEDAALLRIDSSRGTVFKNNDVSTVLSVTIFYGSQQITDSDTLKETFGVHARLEWKWQKIGEETYNTILSTDNRINNDGFAFVLSPEDVNTKVTFICELVV